MSSCNDNEALIQTPPPPRFAWSPSPAFAGEDSVMCSRGASASELCFKLHERPPPKREEWSAERRLGRGPRHAGECYHSLALRAWRAPQDNPLARTACFGRAAPRGAPPRFALTAVDRRPREPLS